MQADVPSNALYIGWDVGGWNCDKNKSSRDALVVLDANRTLLGQPWRGNLRNAINQANTTAEWVQALLDCCQVAYSPDDLPPVVLAIDTPLGFSQAFRQLINGEGAAGPIADSATNPYLYRRTARYLFEQGLAPLSPVKDMIGSQATKGMHALARFAPRPTQVEVWQGLIEGQIDGVTKGNRYLHAIEAYPAACKHSGDMGRLLEPFIVEQHIEMLPLNAVWQGANFVPGIDHDDKRDALICALLAWMYDNEPDWLQEPLPDTPPAEGWIFVPKDGLEHE